MKKRAASSSCFSGKLKKKGMSHIEIIMSFIIFVAAVGFALYFFSPFDSTRLVESTLNYGFREIDKEITIVFDTYNVKINSEEIPDGENTIAVNIPNVDLRYRTRVIARITGQNDIVLDSSRGLNLVYINSVTGWANIDSITIDYSEEFKNDVGVDTSISEKILQYDIITVNKGEVISEKKFKELKEKYDLDYVGLKEDFNFPNRVNLGFELKFSDSDFTRAERNRPDGVEVFVETMRKKVLRDGIDEVGRFTDFADLSVSVW